jgi:hypothetical protein
MAKGIPFKYGRGQCIFCTRQPPEVKISREHIFSDWLRDEFPRDASTTHTLGFINWLSAPTLSQPIVNTKQGQGHAGSKKVRAVCRSCNETWMSTEIEDRAKPILIPLFNSEEVSINAEMQQVLATWAAKTAMTAEQVDPANAAILQHERTWLKEHLSPPREGWNIWIGSYGGMSLRHLGIYQHLGKLAVPSVDKGTSTEHNLHLCLIGMRHLVFLIMSSSWPKVWDIFRSLGTPNGVGLARIWPITEANITWPRPLFMLDPAIEYFTTYMARVMEQPINPSANPA